MVAGDEERTLSVSGAVPPGLAASRRSETAWRRLGRTSLWGARGASCAARERLRVGGGGRAGGADGGGDADDRRDERYERPGAGAVEKLGGRPAGCGDGDDDGATMATTSAPPNWDDVLRRGRAADVGSAPDVASAAAARASAANARPRRRVERAVELICRSFRERVNPRRVARGWRIDRIVRPAAGRRPGRSDGATLSPGLALPSAPGPGDRGVRPSSAAGARAASRAVSGGRCRGISPPCA
jgi:hypothetical protein